MPLFYISGSHCVKQKPITLCSGLGRNGQFSRRLTGNFSIIGPTKVLKIT